MSRVLVCLNEALRDSRLNYFCSGNVYSDKVRCVIGLGVIALFCSQLSIASSEQAVNSCRQLQKTDIASWVYNEQTLTAGEPEEHRVGRGQRGWRYQLESASISVSWIVIGANANNMTALQIETQSDHRPLSQWVLSPNCTVRSQREISYNGDGLATSLSIRNNNQPPVVQLLNPPVPEIETVESDQSVLLALVDSGVNYTLPLINSRLARDSVGDLLSQDYWDNDGLPFDAHPTGSAFNVVRHGTRTASSLLREAPNAQLVAYRYPRPDMSRMTHLVAHAAEHGVSIVGLPLGGNRKDQWQAFAEAAKLYPDILFIASAGNNGRNIDQQAVYPASLPLENMLVVTSADDFIQPAERVNWGRSSVDYMLPAEMVSAVDFDGSPVKVSGSSYAVPRMVAMAARMKAANPAWLASDIKAEFARRYASGTSFRYVNGGYIADPMADKEVLSGITSVVDTTFNLSNTNAADHTLPLTLFALGDSWSSDTIKASVVQAAALLTQCNISVPAVELQRISAADYLMDLSVSNGHTLFSKLRPAGQKHPVAIVFARDTTMLDPYDGEAFGEGNTRRRHWMRDTVWLTHGIRDAGIALAHELFHVLANSGEHSRLAGNLMQESTSGAASTLTKQQCRLAIDNALAEKLIKP